MSRIKRVPLCERVLRWFLCIAFVYVQIPAAQAETADRSASEEERFLPGRLTLGVRGGNDEFEGLGDLLIPLMYRNGGLLFFNPRVGANDNSEQEIQVGLGYRFAWSGGSTSTYPSCRA